MKRLQKLFSFKKKDKKSKEEIYQQANSSFEFNYSITNWLDQNKSIEEVAFSEAIQKMPQEAVEMKEVDYYA